MIQGLCQIEYDKKAAIIISFHEGLPLQLQDVFTNGRRGTSSNGELRSYLFNHSLPAGSQNVIWKMVASDG